MVIRPDGVPGGEPHDAAARVLRRGDGGVDRGGVVGGPVTDRAVILDVEDDSLSGLVEVPC